MNYIQALEAMASGDKIKLPEWQGYWFKDTDGILKVVTKKGDIVETPELLYHKNRADWRITNGQRDIGGAITAAKAGKKIKRRSWNSDINVWVTYDSGSLHSCCRDGCLLHYTPTVEDTLAGDWIIV